LLNAYQLKRSDFVGTIFQTQLNDLASAFQERVKALGLSVATAQGWNRGDIEAFFVALNYDGEFAGAFHEAILAWGRSPHVSVD